MFAASSTAGRTGLPVCTRRAFVPSGMPRTFGKPVPIVLTRRARKRFARPITPFCSWIRVGMRKSEAASTGGTVGYPPKPTTAAGRSRRSTETACTTPRARVSAAFAISTGERPEGVADATSTTSSAGKLPASAPTRSSVASATLAPRRFSAPASDSAGKRCPPVPPAEMRMSGSALIAPPGRAGRASRRGAAAG
jgi:hypothetical protein